MANKISDRTPNICHLAPADDLKDQKVDGDGFTRAYTEEEKRKMAELAPKYQEGIFPEGEPVQTESADEAERLGFCFPAPGSPFYLPDRELTEEEAVEIAKEWLIKIYDITEEGLEIDYSFQIYAKDGSLVYTAGIGRNVEKEAFAVTEADALLPELRGFITIYFTKKHP